MPSIPPSILLPVGSCVGGRLSGIHRDHGRRRAQPDRNPSATSASCPSWRDAPCLAAAGRRSHPACVAGLQPAWIVHRGSTSRPACCRSRGSWPPGTGSTSPVTRRSAAYLHTRGLFSHPTKVAARSFFSCNVRVVHLFSQQMSRTSLNSPPWKQPPIASRGVPFWVHSSARL